MFGISTCHCYHLSVFDIKEPLGTWPNIYWFGRKLCDHIQFGEMLRLKTSSLSSSLEQVKF